MVKRGHGADGDPTDDGNRVVKLRRLHSATELPLNATGEAQLRLQSLPDELLLRIFSFLTAEELIKAQSVSRRISALTKDSQLWKSLYHERFVYRRFGRVLKNGFAKQRKVELGGTVTDPSNRTSMDWKSKYRLSHKWSNGTCNCREIMLASKVLPKTFLCLRGNVAITVDSECGLRAWKMKDEKQTLIASTHLKGSNIQQDMQPSALSVEIGERRPNKLNIIIGSEDGHMLLYTFDLNSKAFEQRQRYSCFNDQTVSALAQASHGFLLAMSGNQAMSLYQTNWLDTGKPLDTPRLVSSLRSQSQWKPVSVSLRASTTHLMASIIYAYPKFLSGWSVGLQELRWHPSSHELLSTRIATSPQLETSSMSNRLWKVEYLPPTSTKPTSLCYTHPYLLATHPDNTLSLYMVRSTDSELSISSGMRLWGHTSDVYAANIGDRGKAVTVAYGGEVRVWQLEEGLTSALARKATPGPLVSVKLQPRSKKHGLNMQPEETILSDLAGVINQPQQNNPDGQTPVAAIDFDEERLVVLKNRGTESQAMYIYDFT